MAIKYFCDLCPNEIPVEERILITVTDVEGKPVTPACETCVFCKERLKQWLDVQKHLKRTGGGNA